MGSIEEREKRKKLKCVKYRQIEVHFIEKKNRAVGEIILKIFFTIFL